MTDVLQSRIEKVQVYRSGALITRVVDKVQKDWPEELVLGPLPLSVEDDSIRAQMIVADDAGIAAEILEIEVEVIAPRVEKISNDGVQQAADKAEQDVHVLRQRLEHLQEQQQIYSEFELSLARDFDNKLPQALSGQVWREGLHWQRTNKAAMLEQQQQIEQKIEVASEILLRAQRDVDEAQAGQKADLSKLHKRLRLRLSAGPELSPSRLQFSYLLRAARWRPVYVLRVQNDYQSADLAMRAMVSQGSGESWEAVQLELSTATWQRNVQLPELRSKRIGRSQPEAHNRAWREPPENSAALFADYERALSQHNLTSSAEQSQDFMSDDDVSGSSVTALGGAMQAIKEKSAQVDFAEDYDDNYDEDDEDLGFGGAPPEMEIEMVMAAEELDEECDEPSPVRSRSMMAAPAAMKKRKLSKKMRSAPRGAHAPAAPSRETQNLHIPTPLTGGSPQNQMLNYPGLLLQAWDKKERGQLRSLDLHDRLEGLSRQEIADVVRSLASAQKKSMQLEEFSSRTVSLSSSAGSFDYSYRAAGRVTVPGDGKLHNVPVLSGKSPVQITLVLVPRESTQAVRVASLQNPLRSPLLSGPVEVYLQGEFLVDTEIETLPSTAKFDVGLGVEEAIKVARNSHFKEQSQGLLGGELSLHHEVSIEIASGLAQDVKLEIRERIPVRDDVKDKDIEIKVGDVEPPWEDWTQGLQHRLQGGKRWILPLAAGATQKIHYSYNIEIDSKNELVGGNRREEMSQ